MNRHEKHAEGASKHTTGEFTMPFGLDMTGFMYQPAFAAMADVNGRLYTGLIELNKEWANFVNRRLQDDLGLPQQFGAARRRRTSSRSTRTSIGKLLRTISTNSRS